MPILDHPCGTRCNQDSLLGFFLSVLAVYRSSNVWMLRSGQWPDFCIFLRFRHAPACAVTRAGYPSTGLDPDVWGAASSGSRWGEYYFRRE